MKEVTIKEVDSGFIVITVEKHEHSNEMEKHIDVYEYPDPERKLKLGEHATIQRALFASKVFLGFQKEDHEHSYEEENSEYCMICGKLADEEQEEEENAENP